MVLLIVRNVSLIQQFLKNQRSKKKMSQGSVTVIKKMRSYEEARVNLTNCHAKKLKYLANIKTGTTIRMTKKKSQSKKLLYELLPTTTKMKQQQKQKKQKKEKKKKKSFYEQYVHWCIPQLSKLIQSRGFLGALLGKLPCPLMKVAVPFRWKCAAPIMYHSISFCNR